MKIFTHPQETWDRQECESRAKYAPKDHWGNRPPAGLISRSASPYPMFGQTVRYNGGFIATDGKLYDAEAKPLPKIHKDYEIVPLCSWGMKIQKKSSAK